MLTFADFLEELTKKELTLNPAEVRRMVGRYGPKVLRMGNLQEDGSLLIPVDCVLEAVQSLENRALADAIKGLRSEDFAPMLESVDSLVERVAEVRKRNLSTLIDEFQSTPDDEKAHEQWRHIEKVIFGVDLDAAR